VKTLVLILVLSVVALTSCSAGVVVFKFYVVVNPDDTAKFFGEIATIAKENGLETATGQIGADSAVVLRMMEGRGRGVKLWVQNSMLTGREDPSVCGVPVRDEPYADPAQFQVSTEPRFFGLKADATKLGEQMFSGIQKLGFDVRPKPVVCGAAALRGRL
jgi:hypothetical protein